MSNYNYDLCAFIGRFQILHLGHVSVIKEALSHAKNVLILVGSSDQPRSHRNPFTFEERSRMIRETFADVSDRIIIRPLSDYRYNDTKWTESVQRNVAEVFSALNNVQYRFMISKTPQSPKPSIALIGHGKDNSSYYLKLFPQWDSIDVPNYENFSATPMRTAYFSNIGHLWVVNADGHRQGDKPIEHLVSTPVRDFLIEFQKTEAYKYIVDEYEFVQDYKRQWTITLPDGTRFPPYPVIHHTVDACVIQSGNVLLVKRGGRPGKGLWALPGGFLNANETLEEAMLRELKEETKIKVPKAVLKGSIVTHRAFDDPERSARGRTITEGFLIKLQPEMELSGITKPNATVEGADDAVKAAWVPLAEVDPRMLFEDHYAILEFFKAYI